MLRAPSRQVVTDIIEQSFFGSSNFIVEFGDGSPIVFSVSFIPDRRFSFEFRRAGKENRVDFTSIETPGERFLTRSSYYYDDVNEAFRRLSGWIERVREELVSANPFARELVALREQLESQIAEVAGELEGFFSAAEAAAMSARLDELASKLNKLQANNEKLELDLEKLNKIIEDLSEAATVVNKSTWYRMASGRLLSGLKSLYQSREARELALEAAKKFLLEGPK